MNASMVVLVIGIISVILGGYLFLIVAPKFKEVMIYRNLSKGISKDQDLPAAIRERFGIRAKQNLPGAVLYWVFYTLGLFLTALGASLLFTSIF